MTNSDFPEGLRDLIRGCLPNIDAVEILLLLSRQPRKQFEVSEIAAASRPELSEAAIRSDLKRLFTCGLLRENDGRYRFTPASTNLRDLVRALEKLYNERPVTLVRTIYALRDEPMRAFSDAFRLKS
jgi:hypothetical protein